MVTGRIRCLEKEARRGAPARLVMPEIFSVGWRNLFLSLCFHPASKMSGKEAGMDRTISTKDLQAKLDQKQGITVVETLAPERYREAHLPGALNLPPERVKELAPQLLPNKNAEIVTYCSNTH